MNKVGLKQAEVDTLRLIDRVSMNTSLITEENHWISGWVGRILAGSEALRTASLIPHTQSATPADMVIADSFKVPGSGSSRRSAYAKRSLVARSFELAAKTALEGDPLFHPKIEVLQKGTYYRSVNLVFQFAKNEHRNKLKQPFDQKALKRYEVLIRYLRMLNFRILRNKIPAVISASILESKDDLTELKDLNGLKTSHIQIAFSQFLYAPEDAKTIEAELKHREKVERLERGKPSTSEEDYLALNIRQTFVAVADAEGDLIGARGLGNAVPNPGVFNANENWITDSKSSTSTVVIFYLQEFMQIVKTLTRFQDIPLFEMISNE